VIAVVLLPSYGLFSLMLADSAKHIVHASVSAYLLSRRMGGLGQRRLLVTSGKTGLAALAMALVAAFITPVLSRWIGSAGLIGEILRVGVSGGLSIAVFLFSAALLNIEELNWLASLLRRRLNRGG
jgi:peptidoglycan biosynthesis protein MviN/MurJ (putative lipid II flippase)